MKNLFFLFFLISCNRYIPVTNERVAGVLYKSTLQPFVLEGDTVTEKGLGRSFTDLAKNVSALKSQSSSLQNSNITFQIQILALQKQILVFQKWQDTIKNGYMVKLDSSYFYNVGGFIRPRKLAGADTLIHSIP